jgi:hypothetical protein
LYVQKILALVALRNAEPPMGCFMNKDPPNERPSVGCVVDKGPSNAEPAVGCIVDKSPAEEAGHKPTHGLCGGRSRRNYQVMSTWVSGYSPCGVALVWRDTDVCQVGGVEWHGANVISCELVCRQMGELACWKLKS